MLQPLRWDLLLQICQYKYRGMVGHQSRWFWGCSTGRLFWCKGVPPKCSQVTDPILSMHKHHKASKKYSKVSSCRAWCVVFSMTGGIGWEATTFYKRLADMLSVEQGKPYSVVMVWFRSRPGFAILRSAITRDKILLLPQDRADTALCWGGEGGFERKNIGGAR